MQTPVLPPLDFAIRLVDGKKMIFDPIRKKHVQLTPEEGVRQRLVRYLVEEKDVPLPLIAIEKGFLYRGMLRRADIIVHDNNASPLLLAECKAPNVPIHREDTFKDVSEQITRYNKVVRAKYLIFTNGISHYCYHVDHSKHTIRAMKVENLPSYRSSI